MRSSIIPEAPKALLRYGDELQSARTEFYACNSLSELKAETKRRAVWKILFRVSKATALTCNRLFNKDLSEMDVIESWLADLPQPQEQPNPRDQDIKDGLVSVVDELTAKGFIPVDASETWKELTFDNSVNYAPRANEDFYQEALTDERTKVPPFKLWEYFLENPKPTRAKNAKVKDVTFSDIKGAPRPKITAEMYVNSWL